ncbi:MAG: mechanosensitive ion channel domain-containing protein [Brumimicrobium sp.]
MKSIIKVIVYVLLSGLVIFLYNYESPIYDIIQSSQILRSLASYIIFIAIVSITAILFKLYYSKRYKIPRGKKNNVHYGIENIANFLKGIGIIIAILGAFGIHPQELITAITIVAAAIAIITKEYIVDFLSGIHLSFSNAFEIGDYVKLENQKGKIIGIKMLKTVLLNDDEDVVVIPNTKVHYNEIINYTKRDVRFMNVDFQIALKFINSIEDLETELINALKSFEEFIEPKSYNLKVVEVKMDYIDLKFQYTLINNDMELQRKVRKKTIREVFNFVSTRGGGNVA